MFFVSNAFAQGGPTSVGPFSIGMGRSEFIAVAGVDPVICKPSEEPRLTMYCSNLLNRKQPWLGTVKYSVGDVQWELMEFDGQPMSVDVVFYKERLIRVGIIFPEVDIETLTSKYGSPKISDGTKIEKCQNKGGARFENAIGILDMYWTNGRVKSIFRLKSTGPTETCTDVLRIPYYILEESDSVKIIENALKSLEEEKKQKAILQSPF
jgi:hypothetical protein